MPATSPARERDSQRSYTPSSSSSNLTNSVATNVPVTLEALLTSHSSAPDPKLAALEQAISERNLLSSQNSQLWKLIEKQRAGYNQILKELERVRNERDTYKARLAGDGTPVSDRRNDTRHYKQLAGASNSSSSSSSSPLPQKQHLNRFYSDDQVTPRSSSHPNPHPLHMSRSQERLSSESPNPSQPSQNPTSTASQPASRHKSPLPTLVVPPCSESLPEVSATSENASHSFRDDTAADNSTPSTATSTSQKYTHYTHGYSDSIISSLSSSSAQLTSNSYSHQGSVYDGINDATSTELIVDGVDTSTKPKLERFTSSPSDGTPASDSIPPEHLSLPPATQSSLSRDSRITLPDEAKQFIANMGESPTPSPRGDSFALNVRQTAVLSSQLSQSHGSHGAFSDEHKTPVAATSSVKINQVDDQEFLDLDEETPEEDESEGRDFDEYEVVNAPAVSVHPPSHAEPDYVQPPVRKSSHASTEDFPSPPYSNASHPVYGTTNVTPIPIREQSELRLDMEYQLSSSTSRPPKSEEVGLQRSSDRQPQSATDYFRALPLLPTDLPHTRLTVSHSFVRPNDRGKEVLSFMVHVNPGSGKEGWKVEKLYSDVLNLDQRVRNNVGKGIGKKIASLPEGKLWKDHAPAKVDQRKAVLENYLQTLINLPVKNNDEVIAFFTSDIVKETMQPVMQAGHKEGYLTKRGKNFGGWKTRYFVLQGPVLEYFDCRGGTHLGSITVTGAQIGRQQRTTGSNVTDEEKEYRHAFLIVEAKKGPGGNHPRHVLCAESDADRDSWVEILVRYFLGTYSEEPVAYSVNGSTPVVTSVPQPQPQAQAQSQPRPSISSDTPTPKKPTRGLSRDDISKGAAVPLSQLPQDPNNAKLFQSAPMNPEDYPASSGASKPLEIPNDRQPGAFTDSQTAKRILERGQGQPSSLPDSSPLSNHFPSPGGDPNQQRANSELGHYADMQPGRQRQHSPERNRSKDPKHALQTSGIGVNPSPTASSPSERVPSPDKMDTSSKVKISGPLNGAPIPAGYKFGGKDAVSESSSTPSDRREKAKSRSFWGFGRPNGTEKNTPVYVSRAVFGVTLEEALDVAQIANLPAIVFRCIQYLEAKKADQEEGIYRLSGSSAVIKNLKDRFNAEGDVNLLASDEYWDPHAIAGLLKSFLRELPASILTRDLHLRFLAVIDFIDPQERIRELSQLIASLPIANYSLLRALTAHLILIVQNSAVNKMTMRNVGIVFSPTLGIPAGVFSLMLGEFNRVFNVDTGDPTSKDDISSSESLGESQRRNSRQYSEGAADQLLGLAGRSLTTPAEDGQSDTDDLSSVQEDSSTEADATTDTSSQIRLSPPDTPMASNSSRASGLAASRGLNITVTHSERGNRHSRMIGLPTSPRPPLSPAHSSSSSPTH